tara:strand:- start:6723 stop:7250 length:528 start_codon:yes stop_codon:yes gene_type:complete
MTFDYKKYSLENLENWIHDAMSSGEASPQEIYDTIKGVVDENYNVYKNATQKAYELLALLNGNGEGHISSYPVSKVEEKLKTPIQQNPQYTEGEMDAMTAAAEEEELISKGYFKDNGFWRKSKIWTVEIQMDGLTGDAFIPIPDDLSDVVGWNVDDELEWCDNKNGSYILRKVNK